MNIIIAIVILIAYTITLCIIGKRIPNSLSASVFTLSNKLKWIWTAIIIAICFLCVPTFVDKCAGITKYFAFASICGLTVVGGIPLVKIKDDKLQHILHTCGAIICAICSQVAIGYNNPWLLFIWCAFPIIFGIYVKTTNCTWKTWKTKIFWAEMICFINTFIFCLI